MIDFVLNIRSELGLIEIFANLIQKRYLWIRLILECTTKVKYKIDHNSKTNNRTKKIELKNPFQNIAHLWDEENFQPNG